MTIRVLCGSIVLTIGLILGGCAQGKLGAPVVAPAERQLGIVDRLYFGQSIPGGGLVTAGEWAQFLEEIVTPRFPSGLTVIRAEGQWREASGHIAKEPTSVIELIHPADEASERAIGEIISAYRQRFQQEAVLRVQSRVEVSF